MKSIIESNSYYICEIQSPVFQTLTPEEVEVIKSSKTPVLFNKNETLTKQGAFSSYILYIFKGFIKKHIEEKNERYINISIHGKNELIGLSSLFQQKKYLYTTVALTETHAILIETSSLQVVLKQNPLFSYEIIQQYCKENKHVFEVLNNVAFKQMHAKLASALLFLSQFNNFDIFNLLNRREIAAFATLSVESTVKLLKEFEQEGLIHLKDKDIKIINESKLKEYSNL